MDSNQPKHEKYKNILENIVDVVWELDKNFNFTYVSPNVKKLYGYEAEELIGHNATNFMTEESKAYLREQVKINILKKLNGENNAFVLHEMNLICKDGKIKWIEISARVICNDGNIDGYIGTTHDISNKKESECRISSYIEELKKNNTELKRLASTDLLTGAYSRRKFEDDINYYLNNNEEMRFSLILIDIDNFKSVNDRYGHIRGDKVLQNVTKLIFNNIRTTDKLFRWGGEEFIIILPDTKLESAKTAAEKIRNIIQIGDFGIDNKITVSLGVGESSNNESVEEIIVRIDRLLYYAKKQGGNKVLF
ncbi:MAG: diguanylate cyclase [Eubacteriaceae bacterium]|nr:diguanylate cyclase [Eubacteriaceae bacterium]